MLFWHIPDNLNALRLSREGLMPLFLSGVARRAAIILISLFSPVYIFQTFIGIGASIKLAIIFVLLFYILEAVSKLGSLVWAENLSQKKGFKGIIRASVVPFLIFIISIMFASEFVYAFLLAAIAIGIHNGFFWWGYHGYFVKSGDSSRFGVSIGKAGLLETSVAVVIPFLGGVIAAFAGFWSLYGVSFLFMLLALFLLGKDHDKKQRRNIKFTEIINVIKSHKSMSLAYMGSGAEGMLYVVAWPVFLFLVFGQVVSLGIIVSVSALIAAVFALSMGEWVDKQGERKIVRVGAPLVFLSWILRSLERSFGFFVLADSLWNFGQRMVGLPLNTLTYKKALEGKSTARAILYRETTMIIGLMCALILVIIATLFVADLRVAFVIAAAFSLLPLVAVFRRRLTDKNEYDQFK